eukprot:scaffold119419_cov36-Prasinocladus_malaysianus.AAC.1
MCSLLTLPPANVYKIGVAGSRGRSPGAGPGRRVEDGRDRECDGHHEGHKARPAWVRQDQAHQQGGGRHPQRHPREPRPLSQGG